MESEDSAPNCSSNGGFTEMDDYLDEALEDDEDDADDDNYRSQNPAVSKIDNANVFLLPTKDIWYSHVAFFEFVSFRKSVTVADQSHRIVSVSKRNR